MKKLLLFFVLSLSVIFSFSQQSWVELMQDPNSNFYDVQNAFNSYWENRDMEKGKGWKQYKRWEYFMEPRVYPTGERFAPDAAYSAYKNYIQSLPTNRSLTGAWNYIGNNYVPVGGGSGRINCLAFHPSNSNIIYAGAPAGGLWISMDGGTTWNTNTDDLASMGVSSIVIHPTNPDTVFIATGDGDASDTYSIGLLKSVDGGATFQSTGMNFSVTQGRVIRKVLINPVNTDTMLAATNGGIFRSADGGNNWQQISSISTYDLEFKPGNPDVVYASTNGRLYVSTDAGISFTQATNGLPSGFNEAGRCAIGVTPANPDYVYLLFGKNTDYGFFGLYRSTDSGNSFVVQSDTLNILGWAIDGSDDGGQAWYDLAILVSPANPNLIWTGGVNVWKSSNGGVTWSLDAHWYGGGGAPYVHADIHAMENIPGQSNSFLIGCDGGVFKTTNAGNTYSDISNNLKIAQIYKMSQSTTDEHKIITGLQDNGTALKTSLGFRRILGGDGMDCIIDHSNDNIMYGEYYYGAIYKSVNNGFNFSKIVDSDDTLVSVDERGDWVTPYIMHPTDPNTLLVGKTQVYRSANGGSTWSQVDTISGGSGKLIALAYAPSNPDYIYAVKKNRVFVSTDGTTFTDRSSGLPTTGSWTNVVVDAYNPQKVWITFSGYSSNKIYYSANAGQNWSNYSTGLPNIPVNCIVFDSTTNGLYTGTDIGVFYRDSSFNAWQYYSDGLPNTIVNDLEIFYSTGKIRAATYGRGVWESERFSNITNDASIVMIENPVDNVCNTSFSPQVILKNAGDNDLFASRIYYSVDGGAPVNFNWSGLLHPGEEEMIYLPVAAVTTGPHSFMVYTSGPNNSTDNNPSNDTIQSVFNVITTGNNVELNLLPDCFGEEISWEITDGSSQVIVSAANGTYQGNINSPSSQPVAITKNICLDAGCYTFTIFDVGTNGLNGSSVLGCNFDGTYFMNDEAGSLLFQDTSPNGDFDSLASHNFCVSTVYAASFSSVPTKICSGESIQFNDLSTSGTNSWNWTFAGGTPVNSTLQNPIVTYSVAGTYDVTLQAGDGTNSNTKTMTGYITVYDSPVASVTFDSLLCFGDCSAEIDLTVNGGTQPISYLWTNNEQTEDLFSLCSGDYGVLIRDENGCVDSTGATIYTPAEIVINLSMTQATCGSQDGMITGNISGGTLPYILNWSNGDSLATITGLDIGTYTLTITDDNNCMISNSSEVTNPNAPFVNATSVNESCEAECDGSIASVSGGGTGTLSLNWTNGAGTADTVNMVCPGIYIVSVVDTNLCEDRDTVEVLAGTPYPVCNFNISDTTVGVGQNVSFVNLSSGANQHNWDFGDGGTSTFSSTSHSYDSLGTYMVVLVSCKNGCCDSDTGYVYVIDVSSVSALDKTKLLNIYPNPANEWLIVDFLNGSTESVIKVFDVNGKLMLLRREFAPQAKIDVNSYSNGVYIIEVNCYDQLLRFKFIKD